MLRSGSRGWDPESRTFVVLLHRATSACTWNLWSCIYLTVFRIYTDTLRMYSFVTERHSRRIEVNFVDAENFSRELKLQLHRNSKLKTMMLFSWSETPSVASFNTDRVRGAQHRVLRGGCQASNMNTTHLYFTTNNFSKQTSVPSNQQPKHLSIPVTQRRAVTATRAQAAQAWGEGWGYSKYKEMYGGL